MVFIEGDVLYDQLKAGALPQGLSRVIIYGSVSASSPSFSPSSSASGAVVLSWKAFLDGGDRLRGASLTPSLMQQKIDSFVLCAEPSSLSAVPLDEDAAAIVVLSGNYSRAALLTAKNVLHVAQAVASGLDISDEDSSTTFKMLEFMNSLHTCTNHFSLLNSPDGLPPCTCHATSVFSFPAAAYRLLHVSHPGLAPVPLSPL